MRCLVDIQQNYTLADVPLGANAVASVQVVHVCALVCVSSDQSRCRVLYTLELCKHRLGDTIQQNVGIHEA